MALIALHLDDVMLFHEVAAAMRRVASQYQLPLKNVIPHPNPEAPSCLGDCSQDGTIRLVLRFKVKGEWTEARRREDVWRTAAHELAHLRHFNHGVAFQEFEQEMLEAMENKQESQRQKLLDKLVKLQKQREGEAKLGNSAAAEAFAAAINRMLIEHELHPTDIDFARKGETDPVVEIRVDRERYGILRKKVRIAWQETLAEIVASANLCKILIVTGTNTIIFVGTKSHATVAEYTYGVLVPTAEKLADKEYYDYHMGLRRQGKPVELARGFRPAWLNGFTSRIRERLAEARKEAVAQAVAVDPTLTESKALVVLGGSLTKVTEYIDGKFGKVRRYADCLQGGRRYHADGNAWGRAAADRMALGRKGIESTSVKGLLGS